MTRDQKIIRTKVGLLELAKQLGKVRHVPIGRSGGAEGTVPENPEPD